MKKRKKQQHYQQANQTQVQIPPSLDERMRIFANLLIDRILEDKKKGELKFTKK